MKEQKTGFHPCVPSPEEKQKKKKINKQSLN